MSEEDMNRLKESVCRENFGIQKVERLPGNIGYVDLRGFAWIGFPGAGDSIVALMQLISHCDALIFDVRRNGGGEVETLQVYVSYFVQPEPKLYDSLYYRPTNETQQLWTIPYVPGGRMPDVPLYILTSRVTGSGGEAFAYILKGMGRATVVGEPTRGAAHTTAMEIVQEHFQVEYPSGRSISPFTQGDWEGVGVQPDIAVPPEEALQAAHLHALERLIHSCQDDIRRRELDWDLEIARNSYAPLGLEETILARYVGQYGDRTIGLAGGALTYSRQGSAWKLIPLGENRFLCPDWLKLEFDLDERGQALSVQVAYRDGRPGLTLPREV
jgi:C-terminal processing protease CtpA/Prc